jgi:hypothetical protein
MTYLPEKTFQVSINWDGNSDNYRIKSQIGSVQYRYTFKLPSDMRPNGLRSLKIFGNITPGAAQTDRDIDRFISAHQPGEVETAKIASDTTTLYDLSAFANKTYGFEMIDLIPSPTAGDIVGLNMDHNGLGGSINYYLIEGIYY